MVCTGWLAGWQRRRWLAWGMTVPPHDGWHILNGCVRNGRCCKRTATGLAGRGGRTAASSVQGARRGGSAGRAADTAPRRHRRNPAQRTGRSLGAGHNFHHRALFCFVAPRSIRAQETAERPEAKLRCAASTLHHTHHPSPSSPTSDLSGRPDAGRPPRDFTYRFRLLLLPGGSRTPREQEPLRRRATHHRRPRQHHARRSSRSGWAYRRTCRSQCSSGAPAPPPPCPRKPHSAPGPAFPLPPPHCAHAPHIPHNQSCREGLIAVNYAARASGVTCHMRIAKAKLKVSSTSAWRWVRASRAASGGGCSQTWVRPRAALDLAAARRPG